VLVLIPRIEFDGYRVVLGAPGLLVVRTRLCLLSKWVWEKGISGKQLHVPRGTLELVVSKVEEIQARRTAARRQGAMTELDA
jgi:hypothetical protein